MLTVRSSTHSMDFCITGNVLKFEKNTWEIEELVRRKTL